MRLAREGNVVAMFPEGTRRRKGLVKKFEARPRTGAARIALEAGVPLVPAAVKGTDRLLRLARSASPTARRSTSTTCADRTCATAAVEATDRLMARIEELEATL